MTTLLGQLHSELLDEELSLEWLEEELLPELELSAGISEEDRKSSDEEPSILTEELSISLFSLLDFIFLCVLTVTVLTRRHLQ